jgi:hypothetical protein
MMMMCDDSLQLIKNRASTGPGLALDQFGAGAPTGAVVSS